MRYHFRWKFDPAHLAPILMLVFLSACSGNNVATGIVDNRLMPCPESPNCVSSDASDDVHGIAPYRLKAAPEVAWEGLKDAVEKQPVGARALVSQARYVTIISWSTYPIVYILPMIGMDTGSGALVGQTIEWVADPTYLGVALWIDRGRGGPGGSQEDEDV